MSKVFSPSSLKFYAPELQAAYGASWPSDGVTVTDAVWQEFIAVPPSGQVLGQSGGQPAWVTAPAPPAPTPAQQAQTALAAGLTITSTSTPSLNGTYGVGDMNTRINIISQMVSIATTTNFTSGTQSLPWLDMSGTPHVFTPAQFRALAIAIGAYFTEMEMIVLTNAGTTLPPATANIA